MAVPMPIPMSRIARCPGIGGTPFAASGLDERTDENRESQQELGVSVHGPVGECKFL
jgi:hypothetical protein